MRPTVPEGVAGLSADNPGAGFLIYHLDKPTWSTGFLVTQNVKNLPAVQEIRIAFLGWEDSLEEGMATHSRILAWGIHGKRSLVGYSPGGCNESDTTEQLTLTQLNLSWSMAKL